MLKYVGWVEEKKRNGLNMKVRLVQSRESWEVIVGKHTEKVFNRKDAAIIYYIKRKIETGKCDDAFIFSFSKNIRVVSYSPEQSGIQVRKGKLLKTWTPFDVREFDTDKDGGRNGGGYWTGYVFTLPQCMKLADTFSFKKWGTGLIKIIGR